MNDLFEPHPVLRPIPQQRVIEKMDAYMSRRDYAGAERHLKYWLEEARQGGDQRGELMVLGELVGHYRKTGQRDEGLARADEALRLIDALDYASSISAATAYVNIATMLNAFGENERAIALFERARTIYEQSGATAPQLLGGLYNNMGLVCAALGRYGEADALYDLAMTAMARVQNGALEQAVTCLNRANLVEARDGMEAGEGAIFGLVEQAVALLDGPELKHDGYYAYVLKTCAPTMAYYGWFADAERFNEEAERIYAGN